MPATVYSLDPETFSMPTDTARETGKSYAKAYQAAQPYNHICIDNFLPLPVIDHVRQDIASMPEAEGSFDRAQERFKSQYSPERLPLYTKTLFYAFNSRSFILFLEEMTGIKGLIPDPYYIGAGIHKTLTGGHLDIHADFNLHKQMKLERRLNVLIYLNPEWKEDYGGSFEIWDKQMSKKEASFVPIYNRMVCFSTGSDTFHGNPSPVSHPGGEARQSIALYYYTATWDSTRKEHTTIFKPRPGTVDETDRREKRRAFWQDVLPPKVYRKVAGRLGI